MSVETATAPKVYVAIDAVANHFSQVGIPKDRKNPQQGWNFRGIDDVLNALSPLLAKHHLVILPRIKNQKCEERVTKGGVAMFHTTLDVEYDFISALDGSKHTVDSCGEIMNSSDKGIAGAMSIAYKLAVIQAFSIPIVGRPEPDEHYHEVISKQAPNQKDWGNKDKLPARDPRIDDLTRKTITDWFLDILNPETFKRTLETITFAKIRDQIVKDASILPESDQLKLRKEAYMHWLTCMIATADGEELASDKWPAAIKAGQFTDSTANMLNDLLGKQRTLAMEGAAQ